MIDHFGSEHFCPLTIIRFVNHQNIVNYGKGRKLVYVENMIYMVVLTFSSFHYI